MKFLLSPFRGAAWLFLSEAAAGLLLALDLGQRKYATIARRSRIAKRSTNQSAGEPEIGGRMSSISSGAFDVACARKSKIIDVAGGFLFG